MIKDRILSARQACDMTQEELGRRIGVKQQTIQKYENGSITNIPLENIKAIAKVCGVTPAYLMGWEEEQKNNDILADIVIELRANPGFRELVETIYNLEKANPEKLSAISAVIDAVKGF